MNADSLVAQWRDVHGIDTAPVEDKVDGYPRKVWRRDGVDVIESYTITGMAHGTPLATATHGGAAGPFLLEVGISSSYHIAKFFGLTGEASACERAAAGRHRANRSHTAGAGRCRGHSRRARRDIERENRRAEIRRRRARRSYRRDGGHHEGADAGWFDEAAGVSLLYLPLKRGGRRAQRAGWGSGAKPRWHLQQRSAATPRPVTPLAKSAHSVASSSCRRHACLARRR